MEDKLEEKLFVDKETGKLILFTFRQYRIIALIWIIISFVSTAISAVNLYIAAGYQPVDWTETINYKIIPWLYLLIILANAFMLYYYYNAIRSQKHAVTDSDPFLFSKSFLWYKKGNYASICGLFLNLVNDSLILYIDLLNFGK